MTDCKFCHETVTSDQKTDMFGVDHYTCRIKWNVRRKSDKCVRCGKTNATQGDKCLNCYDNNLDYSGYD